MTPERLAPLLAAARAAAQQAYCPYSHFRVGAVLLGRDGRLFTGCNIENASYGLSLCAERVALSRAVAEGVREFAALVLVAGGNPPATPCGACRQVLSEFCDAAMPVICAALKADEEIPLRHLTIGALLPHAFSLDRSV